MKDNEEFILFLKRAINRAIEIKALLNDGKFIVVDKKLDGLIKIFDNCANELTNKQDQD